MPSKDQFRDELKARFSRAIQAGSSEVEINSGELHRSLGGYPGKTHHMPSCCNVMHDEMRPGDLILSAPPSGKGASLVIRYKLPRR